MLRCMFQWHLVLIRSECCAAVTSIWFKNPLPVKQSLPIPPPASIECDLLYLISHFFLRKPWFTSKEELSRDSLSSGVLSRGYLQYVAPIVVSPRFSFHLLVNLFSFFSSQFIELCLFWLFPGAICRTSTLEN